MEAAQMNNDGTGDTGEARRLGSSEEDKSRTHGVVREIKNGSDGAIQVLAGPQKPQPQGPTIHWERFLPTGSLKVLLVENDDSTCHVVSALLRNCSYELTAVADGVQAWRILQDLTNHIDLVLTELAMPILSGVGLLCKIMNHITLKNIPVIMMSSDDSMGLVFKCLSKGAVDFLVKPIRKNELKNLWQHVWRRCHSSIGSGSESGTQAKISAKSNYNDDSENNTGSSDELENGSIGLSIQDGSDNGSGTQSSWTKRAAEVDSSQPISPWDQLTDAPDSTCAQVIHTKPEKFSSRQVHVTKRKGCQDQDEQLDNVAMGKDLQIGISRGLESELECRDKFSTNPSKRQNKLSELDISVFEKEQMGVGSENISSKLMDHAENSISVVSNCTDRQVENKALDAPGGVAYTSQIKDNLCSDNREFPSSELTLTRKGVGDVETGTHDDRNVLRHSDLSAFSKYNPAFSASQGPTGNIGSCSPLDNISVAMKMGTIHNSNFTPPNQQSNESSSNNDMGSTTKHVPKREASSDKSESTSAFNCIPAKPLMPAKEADMAVGNNQVQARDMNQRVQVQHHHHHYHHHHHHVHKRKHQRQLDHDDLLQDNMAADSPQCGSSNMVGGPSEVNAGIYSLIGSGLGSNHGSNGQNGDDNGVAGNSQVDGITMRNSDEERFAKRRAALIKFRQKRKERCFEKKVRYQSRKKLAEQRPRVRGQFVRQITSNKKAGKDDITPDDNSSDSEQ